MTTTILPTVQFWQRDAHPLVTPLEWQPAVLEICHVDWQTAHVYLQGRRLNLYQQVFAGQARVLAEWRPVGAGQYDLWINRIPHHITIVPHKITPQAFQTLLEDLEFTLPIAVTIGLARGGAHIGVQLDAHKLPTPATEYWQLARIITGDANLVGMTTWLPLISRQPLQTLLSQKSPCTPARVRAPHAAELSRWLRQPHRQLNDQRTISTVDVYENQLLKLFLQQVTQRLARVQRIATGQLATDSQLLATQLRQMLDSVTFLPAVHVPVHFFARITPALTRIVPYRDLLSAYQYAQQQLTVQLQADHLSAPLNNVPYLYQLWGTLQIIDSLLTTAVAVGYQVVMQRLSMCQHGSSYLRVLADGQAALLLSHPSSQRQLQLIPQRSYRDESMSFLQRPDVTVAMQLPDGSKRVCLFDPKYRLVQEQAKPTKADIDKMHAYRDAIRINGHAIVWYAAILYPGTYQHYGSGLEALPADPSQHLLLQQHLQRVFKTFLAEA